MFNPFQNKIVFDSFTLEAPPCPKCSSTKVRIAPTYNTHAASCHCADCGKFYRWLGKNELLCYMHQSSETTKHTSNRDNSRKEDNHEKLSA